MPFDQKLKLQLHARYKTSLEFDQLPLRCNLQGNTFLHQLTPYFQMDNAIGHKAWNPNQTKHRLDQFL